jgi:hypothetical protein
MQRCDSELKQIMDVGMAESEWKNLYKVDGTTALIALLVPLAEVAIN